MVSRYNKILLPLFYIIDALFLAGSYFVVFYVRFGFNEVVDEHYFRFFSVIMVIWLVVSFVCRTYAEKHGQPFLKKLEKLLSSQIFLLFGIFTYIVTTKGFYLSRQFLIIFICFEFLVLFLLHWFRHGIMMLYRAKGKNFKRLIILGELPTNGDGKPWNFENPGYGYHVENTIHYRNWVVNYAQLLEETLMAKDYDELLIASPAMLGNQIEPVIDVAENHGLRVMILPKYMTTFNDRLSIDYLNGKPVFGIRYEPLSYLHNRVLKRIIDIVFSGLVVLLLYWWFSLIVGLLIKLTSKGPIIFKQKRVGIDGKEFFCYKFRTMRQDEKAQGNAENGFGKITDTEDNRVTKIGSFLRKSNLDELPQFINVLLGSMSVVGPRPHMLQEDLEIREKVQKYRVRNFVKPGITGWAQINGFRGGTKDIRLMQERTNHDIYYIERWSFWLDIKIMWLTFYQMARGKIKNAY